MAWYEAKRDGLGLEFLAAIHERFNAIRTNPGLYALAPGVANRHGVRRAVLTKYPYAVVFVVRPSEILVLAIAHGHQRPGYWRRRV